MLNAPSQIPAASSSSAVVLGKSQRSYALALFSLAVLIYFIVNIQRVAIPGQIFNELQSDLRISASAVSTLGATFMYIYAATQLLAGLLVDKYGGMRVMFCGSILMAIGSILFPLSQSLGTLLLSRMLLGLGCGTAYLSIVKESDRLFSHNFTQVMGLVISLGYFGGVVGTLPLAKSVHYIGWRQTLLLIALATALTVVIIALIWRRCPKPEPLGGRLSLQPYMHGFRVRTNLINLSSYAVNFAIYYVILTVFGRKFLEDIAGLSPDAAAFCCTMMVVLSALLNQFVGILCAYTGNLRLPYYRSLNLLPFIACSMLVFGMLFKGSGPGWGAFFVAAFIIISMTSGFTPITNAMARESNPPGSTGVAVGITNFAAYIMVALLSNVSGLVLDLFKGGALEIEGRLVYPAAAYLCLYTLFLLISVFTFRISLAYPESAGRNIYAGRMRVQQITRFIKIRLYE
ncbi:MAG: MFS transporter [Lentisphaeria bacterium]|jgi:predicted MFS family arabinose efflux permease|nr:MFS transporter [Lentisphaeria bacterium]MDY0175977.1 MFS transporter [Lentisphaeria bacterium]